MTSFKILNYQDKKIEAANAPSYDFAVDYLMRFSNNNKVLLIGTDGENMEHKFD